MYLKVQLQKYWFLLLLMVLGLFEFIENKTFYPLVTSIGILVFFAAIIIFERIYEKRIGLLLIATSLWGLSIELIIKEESSHFNILLILFYLLVAGTVVFNKYEELSEKVNLKRVYITTAGITIAAFMISRIIKNNEIDILQILILISLVIYGLLCVLPEKKQE
ncbi:MAG: hypothetical protein ACI9N1_002814 [Flavobacteriales bacterium]